MTKEYHLSVILEFAYYCDGVRYDKSTLFSSERAARVFIEDISYKPSCVMVYAKIRKFRFVHDICLKYNDKGELENEFYINPNKKA